MTSTFRAYAPELTSTNSEEGRLGQKKGRVRVEWKGKSAVQEGKVPYVYDFFISP